MSSRLRFVLSLILFVAPTPALAAAGCDGIVETCPVSTRPGVVDVADFDLVEPKGVLRSRELQCAIDCLDGTVAPEHTPTELFGETGRLVPPRIPGGVLVFQPGLRYEITESLLLPRQDLGQCGDWRCRHGLTRLLAPSFGYECRRSIAQDRGLDRAIPEPNSRRLTTATWQACPRACRVSPNSGLSYRLLGWQPCRWRAWVCRERSLRGSVRRKMRSGQRPASCASAGDFGSWEITGF